MLSNVYKEVSNILGIDTKLIKNTYTEYWRTIRNSIINLPLKEPISVEEFNSLTTSFNISRIGKLAVIKKNFFRKKTLDKVIKEKIKNAKSKKD